MPLPCATIWVNSASEARLLPVSSTPSTHQEPSLDQCTYYNGPFFNIRQAPAFYQSNISLSDSRLVLSFHIFPVAREMLLDLKNLKKRQL